MSVYFIIHYILCNLLLAEIEFFLFLARTENLECVYFETTNAEKFSHSTYWNLEEEY